VDSFCILGKLSKWKR